MKILYQKMKDIIIRHKWGVVTLLYALLSSTLTYYCLELGNKNPLMNGIFYTFINILTIFVIQSVMYLAVRRWWIASLVTGIPLTVLSIANYYTLCFRNSPISTQDIHNFGTTLSVIDSYSFPINVFVIGIVIFFVLNIAVTVQLYRREKGKRYSLKNILIKNICLLIFCGLFTHFVYFAENPIKPRNTFVWSWEESYYNYGYAASSIEVFQNSMNMVDMPKGYSEEKLLARDESRRVKTTQGKTPDVILILNETFYDMRDLVKLETDVEIMPFIDSLSTRGRAVVAGTGGGTNKSEYELLTSNSLQLMPGITPFNYLNFDDANSAVNYLESLGYSSWGAHCAEALNYERGIVYPKLGFDNVLFREEFGEIEKFGERPYATDEFCFDKMLEDYEQMGDGPRFQYMLTIQNHGGWDLNPDTEDTVHSITDFGDYTDDMNEFLSCIRKTDEAFKRLTEYFENSQRDVIICMVGDHAPSFAVELLDDIDVDKTFALRSTPFVIWSNFDTDYSVPRVLSMPFIMPTVLEMAKIKLSPFYSHMLSIKEDTPVLTAFNLYKTKDGETFNYSDDTKHKEKIDIYFDMVYNNVAEDTNRIDSIFTPQN
ncbi:MAG: sulfatase-like hydrolase/transferase [Clostridia bacterium]|nr:sulfatase-like hydrolase/transferase [Clostridia bacterium]